MPMKKSIRNIKLSCRPLPGSSNGEYRADRGWLDDCKSIVVIEDIDCTLDVTGDRASSSRPRRREADEKPLPPPPRDTVTLGERIIVFTTNLVDKLDPALIRRGRMDMHVERCPTAASSGLHHAVDETRNLSEEEDGGDGTATAKPSGTEAMANVMMIVPVPATNDDKAKAEAGGRDLVTVSRNRDEKRADAPRDFLFFLMRRLAFRSRGGTVEFPRRRGQVRVVARSSSRGRRGRVPPAFRQPSLRVPVPRFGTTFPGTRIAASTRDPGD
ncbi:hypothetical protein BDA96_02G068200 [Sorghum bicolor]|uniref:ATPase AAA-type core domain-containing protein n=1 Tax=Sorghum bicolor TaxID=4558 RepID=A0A921URW6_SORBI|nr:hypothetical protein BDA96_02G068200 [Sorghum bicolor]